MTDNEPSDKNLISAKFIYEGMVENDEKLSPHEFYSLSDSGRKIRRIEYIAKHLDKIFDPIADNLIWREGYKQGYYDGKTKND